jgi:hypothetical protein
MSQSYLFVLLVFSYELLYSGSRKLCFVLAGIAVLCPSLEKLHTPLRLVPVASGSARYRPVAG